MLPKIKKFADLSVTEPFFLIGAAGFEDRAKAIFEEISSKGYSPLADGGIAIEYEPFDPQNDVQGFEAGMGSIGIEEDELNSITFDRFDPDSLESELKGVLDGIRCNRVMLDISGMSKFLITLMLQILADYDFSVVIFYAEADVYHPTEEQYREEKGDTPEETPAFLTQGVYDLVTSRLVSSVAKGGQPIVTISFPTFNHQELMALISELPPHQLITIEGIPRLEEDQWRTEAVRWLNEEIESYIRIDRRQASTFEYQQTFDLLDDIYSEYSDAYRLVLAPTGSKLQTVACSLFRRLHPDIQMVYPVTKEFSETYTEGWGSTWGIDLGQIDETLKSDVSESEQDFTRLRAKIEMINKRTRAD